jgi:hypothetical protein
VIFSVWETATMPSSGALAPPIMSGEARPRAVGHQAAVLLGVLVSTNRMFGLGTVSQIGSASAAWFFCRLT